MEACLLQAEQAATAAEAVMEEQVAHRTVGLIRRQLEAVATRASAQQPPRLTHRMINTIPETTWAARVGTRLLPPRRSNQKHSGDPMAHKARSLTLRAVNQRVDTRALLSKAIRIP